MPRDQEFFAPPRRVYVGPATAALAPALQASLRAYAPALRRRLRQFAVVSRPCADLLTSFPAAAVLIATQERGVAPTALAVARVKGGAPLAAVGEALALPFWMRKLPPAAFDGAPLGRFEAGPDFAKAIGSALPRGDANAAMWLRWLEEALRLGEPRFAAWLARQPIYGGAFASTDAIALLAAYAWASSEPRLAEQTLILRPWGERRRFGQAAFQAANWIERVLNERCAVELSGAGWDEALRVGPFRFEPLKSLDALVQEGEAMRNCVGTYAQAVARGDCAVFSVRCGRRPVANVELRPSGATGAVRIVQLEGPGNTAAPERVARVVDRWIAQLGPCPLQGKGLMKKGPLDPARWRALFAPFVAAYPAAPALFQEASPEQVVRELSRRIGLLNQLAERAS